MNTGKDIYLRTLGEFHHDVASAYNNIAFLLPNLSKIDLSLS
jgi:hypothetical protein